MGTEIFNARWDRTEELLQERDANRWKRRLDGIARLIENASICAAIAIEGDSFLIATNKDFVENSTDQGYLLIDSVMSFFKSIAEGQEPTQSNLKEVFSKICEGAMSGLQLPVHVRDRLSKYDFIDKVISARETQDFRGLRDYIAEQTEIGHHPSDEGSAFAVCCALFQDFQKIIKFIQHNKDINDSSRTAQFINAIKKYNADNIINRKKLAGKVANSEKMHAEMRVLALMEDRLRGDVQYENYIGISKLCCLDCHLMIYAVNHANPNHSHRVEIRGAHNVKHSKNWMPPFNITGNVPKLAAASGSRRSSNQDPFSEAVVAKFGEAYGMATSSADTPGTSGVSEHQDYSGSSAGDAEDLMIRDISSRLRAKQQELQGLALIPGIMIESVVFETIELLLNHLEDAKATLGSALSDYVIDSKANGIVGYLFELNDQKKLSEALNRPVQEVVAILKSKEFVGERVAMAFSSAAFLPRTALVNIADEPHADRRMQNIPILAEVQPDMTGGLFLSARGQAVARAGVGELHSTSPAQTDVSIAVEGNTQSSQTNVRKRPLQ